MYKKLIDVSAQEEANSEALLASYEMSVKVEEEGYILWLAVGGMGRVWKINNNTLMALCI